MRELRALMQKKQEKLADFQAELAEQRLQISELKRELALLKVGALLVDRFSELILTEMVHVFQELMRALRVTNPTVRAVADQMEREEVLFWSNSLQRARVTRWGGMISTPDELLQVKSL